MASQPGEEPQPDPPAFDDQLQSWIQHSGEPSTIRRQIAALERQHREIRGDLESTRSELRRALEALRRLEPAAKAPIEMEDLRTEVQALRRRMSAVEVDERQIAAEQRRTAEKVSHSEEANQGERRAVRQDLKEVASLAQTEVEKLDKTLSSRIEHEALKQSQIEENMNHHFDKLLKMQEALDSRIHDWDDQRRRDNDEHETKFKELDSKREALRLDMMEQQKLKHQDLWAEFDRRLRGMETRIEEVSSKIGTVDRGLLVQQQQILGLRGPR